MKNLSKEQQAELKKKLYDLKLGSRELSDSAIYTYFGKPVFHAYGNGNTRPVSATENLKTHNINPHSGGNKPKFSQVHGRAMLGGTIHVKGPASRASRKGPIEVIRQPVPPRVPVQRHVQTAKAESRKIMPETFLEANAKEITILPPKFTGKNLKTQKEETETFEIQDKKALAAAAARADKKSSAKTASEKQSSVHHTPDSKKDADTQESDRSKEHVQIDRFAVNEDSGTEKEYNVSKYSVQETAEEVQERRAAAAAQAKCNIHLSPSAYKQSISEFLHLNDPKNYKFLPPQFTQQIRPAGVNIKKSEAACNLIAHN